MNSGQCLCCPTAPIIELHRGGIWQDCENLKVAKVSENIALIEANQTDIQVGQQDLLSSKPRSCKFCEKTFKTPGNLRAHERVHIAKGHKITNKKSKMIHFCKHCKFECTGKEALFKHEIIHKIKKCKICGKTCKGPSSLQKHLKVHTGEKPYSCRFCKKKFTQMGDKKKHEHIHAVRCDICKTKFANKHNLSRHITAVHEVKREILSANYVCSKALLALYIRGFVYVIVW